MGRGQGGGAARGRACERAFVRLSLCLEGSVYGVFPNGGFGPSMVCILPGFCGLKRRSPEIIAWILRVPNPMAEGTAMHNK